MRWSVAGLMSLCAWTYTKRATLESPGKSDHETFMPNPPGESPNGALQAWISALSPNADHRLCCRRYPRIIRSSGRRKPSSRQGCEINSAMRVTPPPAEQSVGRAAASRSVELLRITILWRLIAPAAPVLRRQTGALEHLRCSQPRQGKVGLTVPVHRPPAPHSRTAAHSGTLIAEDSDAAPH